MGSIFSCLCSDDFEDDGQPSASVNRRCISLGFLVQQITHMYTRLLPRQEHDVPSSLHTLSSWPSVDTTTDDSFSNSFHNPPRPLPFDDPRCSGLHADERHDKPLINLHAESESHTSDRTGSKIESTSLATKTVGYNFGVFNKCCSEPLLKHPLIEMIGGITYIFPSSEDEDVCPTCLEEYTSENPRITLQCAHPFHLGCIYEWMERSQLCPICEKVIIFFKKR
ncbi:E3 ubiquitin-protein ligase [Apostasia shenzhenica]|uniref:RING-type E3 ubiquitin transferase n=1 Tax=Apostasia shenzhenica TaxID=1088818 RepID=A0A2I0ADR9_9ASPA|nr:E3 ubiquitin-protein ligase [Apostasia shenzhenica]